MVAHCRKLAAIALPLDGGRLLPAIGDELDLLLDQPLAPDFEQLDPNGEVAGKRQKTGPVASRPSHPSQSAVFPKGHNARPKCVIQHMVELLSRICRGGFPKPGPPPFFSNSLRNSETGRIVI